MKGFVQWLAERRYRMILLAAALVLLPGLGVLGQAIVAFAVLRRGIGEGLIVASVASAVIALAMIAAGAEPTSRMALLLASWLPSVALAALLRASRSLTLAVQAATVTALAAVLAAFVLGDPVARGAALLGEYATRLSERMGPLSDEAIEAWAGLLPGTVAGAALLVSVGAVFIARWWQAMTQNPGGFAMEFRQLRLGTVLGVAASIVFVAAGLSGMAVLQNLTLVLLTAYLLQGLAVMHALFGASAAGTASLWLVLTYVGLVLAMQFAVPAVAGLGFLDSWFNFRARRARG